MGATFKKKSVCDECGTYLVRVSGIEEWRFIFDYLTQNGYEAAKYKMTRDYPFGPTKSIFINTKKRWFGFVPVWGGAAVCQKGVLPISVDEFMLFRRVYLWDLDIGEDYCDIYVADWGIGANDNEWIKYHLDEINFEKIKTPLMCNGHTRTFFIKSLCDRFHKITHVENWFDNTEFENFCNELKIQYAKEHVRLINHFEYEVLDKTV